MTGLRAVVAAAAVGVALVLQVSVLSHLAWEGIVPNLVLLVVVAAALGRGSQFAMVLGFAGGVLLDLAPPADHVAGRWALALVVVGYVAGRVPTGSRPPLLSMLGTVAAASFVGGSVFALSGLVLRDPVVGVPELLQVIAVGVLWDLALAPLVLPAVMWAFRRIEPGRVLA